MAIWAGIAGAANAWLGIKQDEKEMERLKKKLEMTNKIEEEREIRREERAAERDRTKFLMDEEIEERKEGKKVVSTFPDHERGVIVQMLANREMKEIPMPENMAKRGIAELAKKEDQEKFDRQYKERQLSASEKSAEAQIRNADLNRQERESYRTSQEQQKQLGALQSEISRTLFKKDQFGRNSQEISDMYKNSQYEPMLQTYFDISADPSIDPAQKIQVYNNVLKTLRQGMLPELKIKDSPFLGVTPRR